MQFKHRRKTRGRLSFLSSPGILKQVGLFAHVEILAMWSLETAFFDLRILAWHNAMILTYSDRPTDNWPVLISAPANTTFSKKIDYFPSSLNPVSLFISPLKRHSPWSEWFIVEHHVALRHYAWGMTGLHQAKAEITENCSSRLLSLLFKRLSSSPRGSEGPAGLFAKSRDMLSVRSKDESHGWIMDGAG